MKNAADLIKKSIKDTLVAFVGDRIAMDPDTIQSLRSWIRMALALLSCLNKALALLPRRI